MVASPLVHRGIHLSCLLGRFWRRAQYIRGYGDAIMEVAISVECVSTRTVSALDHGIQWHIGACSVEQWFADEHIDAWRCVVVCGFTPWSRRSNSHHLEVSHGVSTTLSHEGYKLIQDDMAVGSGVQ